MTPHDILQQAYHEATKADFADNLSAQQTEWVATIVQHAESHKAILTVVMTSLVKKIEVPAQDVRQHKIELLGGYSGRSYDTRYITPFLKAHFRHFAMAESGWLTRSIEQVHPFDFQFPGKIRNLQVKNAFLNILNDLEANQADASQYLRLVFRELSIRLQTDVFQPKTQPSAQKLPLTVAAIIERLRQHFFADYSQGGAARLPVCAIYAAYTLLIDMPRYQGKRLLPMKSHTTADQKSRSIGDIEIVEGNGHYFEAVEIKHRKPITLSIVEDAYQKARASDVSRYYLLTTAEPNTLEGDSITVFATTVFQKTRIEIIVNGVMPSLKYYLRLLDQPSLFVEHYTNVLRHEFETGGDVKTDHLRKWESLLSIPED